MRTKLILILTVITVWICAWYFRDKEEANVTVKEMQVTAYCACEKCCGRFADGITASGMRIKEGDRFVAADMPFNSLVIVPQYNDGKAVSVQDRGGAIKGNRLDVYFDTHQEALEWGRQNLMCVIMEMECPSSK